MNNNQQCKSEITVKDLEWWIDLIKDISVALIISILLFGVLTRISIVVGESMKPTLHNHSVILVNHIRPSLETGNIIVFKTNTPQEYLIKRIIGVPGDTIDIDFDRGVVIRNGVELTEDYVFAPTYMQAEVQFPVTVPEDHLFVLGDNRNNSMDSRYKDIGMVSTDTVLGSYIFKLPFP